MRLVKLSLVLFLACALFPLSAQHNSRACGTPAYKSEWLKKFQAGQIPPAVKTLNVQYVPVNVFIVGNADGGRYLNPLVFLQSLKLLNDDFREQNIQFYINGEIEFISSNLFEELTFGEGNQLMSTYNRPGGMNTYFVPEPPSGTCGYYSPSRDAVVVGNNCMGGNDRTWTHEVGHFLSLPHTFFGWECIDGNDDIPSPAPFLLDGEFDASCQNNPRNEVVEWTGQVEDNCTVAGDGFCDTPPDYLMEGWSCNSAGEYQDSLTDPNGVKFAVPAVNFMSYASNACVETFSEDQKSAMFTNLMDERNLINNENVDSVGADVSELVHVSPENNETLPVSDFVELSWSPVENADFYILQLHNSQNLNGAVQRTEVLYDTSFTITEGLIADRRYYWRVRPVNNYVCDGAFSEVTRFRNGAFPTATIDRALDAAITIAPNPASGGTQLRITGRDLNTSGQLNLQLINAAGQVVVNRPGIDVSAAGFSQQIETADLPQGVYFVRLRLNERLVTRRVIVQ